ncbi:amino acid permease [Formicincola oecophyllae]|uniref:Amino acid permease n=1 Tax=Formicincola oecophyllae TaxID=2558361 RepID=A0A4Y6UBR3_9PROT|nr:amino acid permease [Formicincola oecophyllae]QDH14008.1 amino acid permease [Formicincola oecophyllae]
MTHPFWRIKPVPPPATVDAEPHRRVLSAWHLVALGIGVTVGAGLFSLTGIAAGSYAGPAVTLSFLIAAIACAFAGLCYAELAGMIPTSGSSYSYAYSSLGELAAWVIGWDLMLEYTVNAAAVASSWSGYVRSLLGGWGLQLDPRLTASPGSLVTLSDGTVAHGWLNAPSVVIVLAVTLLMLRGTRQSARVNTILVILKVLVLLAFVALCVPFLDKGHFTPFVPANTGVFGALGWSGIMRAAGMVFFAFIGFEVVSTMTKETKNPQRNIPIGLLGTVAACAIIYVIFAFVLVGVVPWAQLANDPNPVATAMNAAHQRALGQFVKLGITIGYISVVYGLLLGQSRILTAMADDGLLPPAFSAMTKSTQTPWVAVVVSATLAALLAAFVPLRVLGNMTSIGTLLAFVLVCAGVMIMRHTNPTAQRSFRVPGGPWVIPALGVLCCSVVMASMDGRTWLQLFLWLLAGLVVYLCYGMRHSQLNK